MINNMIELFSLKFWIGTQFIIDLFIILCFLVFVKRLSRLRVADPYTFNGSLNDDMNRDNSEKTANEIIEMLEPFVKESRATADSFDRQIKEKKKLIKELNDSLDSRIISINLLIGRAEAAKEDLRNLKMEIARQPLPMLPVMQTPGASANVLDQQNSIIDMHNRGFDIDAIVSKLSMPRGEVKLVIDLKEKFRAMEQK